MARPIDYLNFQKRQKSLRPLCKTYRKGIFEIKAMRAEIRHSPKVRAASRCLLKAAALKDARGKHKHAISPWGWSHAKPKLLHRLDLCR